MQRIIEQELWESKTPADEVNYTWEKDEVAFLARSGMVAKVRFTGERWISNGGYRFSPAKKFYQVEILTSSSFGVIRFGEISHYSEKEFYTELAEAKEASKYYLKQRLESAQIDFEKDTKSIDDFVDN